jgi:hypothetical protein
MEELFKDKAGKNSRVVDAEAFDSGAEVGREIDEE